MINLVLLKENAERKERIKFVNEKSPPQQLQPRIGEQIKPDQTIDGRSNNLGADEGRSADSLPTRSSRIKQGIGRTLLVVAILVGIAGLAYWIYGRYTNVVVYDARIKADMIMISSRIDGWVKEVSVSEGHKVNVNDPLVMIDARESALPFKTC